MLPFEFVTQLVNLASQLGELLVLVAKLGENWFFALEYLGVILAFELTPQGEDLGEFWGPFVELASVAGVCELGERPGHSHCGSYFAGDGNSWGEVEAGDGVALLGDLASPVEGTYFELLHILLELKRKKNSIVSFLHFPKSELSSDTL